MFSPLCGSISAGELVDPSVLLREYGGDAGDELDVEKYLDGDPNMC